jgi:hypothetical protein|eukprot:1720953-Prymnesium_polylepis.2
MPNSTNATQHGRLPSCPHQSAALPVRYPPLASRTGVHRSGIARGIVMYDYVTGKRLHRRHRAKVRLPRICALHPALPRQPYRYPPRTGVFRAVAAPRFVRTASCATDYACYGIYVIECGQWEPESDRHGRPTTEQVCPILAKIVPCDRNGALIGKPRAAVLVRMRAIRSGTIADRRGATRQAQRDAIGGPVRSAEQCVRTAAGVDGGMGTGAYR